MKPDPAPTDPVPAHYLLTPRRLVFLAVLILLLGVILLFYPGSPTPSDSAQTPASTPEPTLAFPTPTSTAPPQAQVAPPSTTSSPASSSPPQLTSSASATPAASGAWRPVAEGFGNDFTNPGPTAADWLTRVGRWVTPDLLAGYRSTDPTRIPSGHLHTIDPSDEGATTTDVTATYDSGLQLAIRLTKGTNGWQVSTVLPMTSTP